MSEKDLETSSPSIREALEESASEMGFGEEPSIEKEEVSSGDSETPEIVGEDLSDDQALVGEESEDAEAQVAQQDDVSAPYWWSADRKQAFAKAPKEVKEAILTHEAERERFVNQLKQEVQGERAKTAQYSEAFKPHISTLAEYGLSEPQAITKLMGWQKALDSNPREAIVKLAATYGLTPEHLLDSDGQIEGGAYDPRLDGALQTIETLQSQFEQQQAWAREQQNIALQTILHQFRTETDEKGNVVRPYVDMLEPQIAQRVKEIRQEYPNEPLDRVLDHAYRTVAEEFDAKFVKPKMPQQSQAMSTKPNITQRVKAAASATVQGAPNGSQGPAIPKGIRANLEAAAKELGL